AAGRSDCRGTGSRTGRARRDDRAGGRYAGRQSPHRSAGQQSGNVQSREYRDEVMNLSEPFIRRPVMTAVLTLSVILFGGLAYWQLPVNDLPAVDYPVIQVTVGYPGASPDT